jgi:SAM-dependent methyltransferase
MKGKKSDKMKILNLGCGRDDFGTHFVDLYSSRPEVIQLKIDEQKLPFPDNYFDEVYSRNVLEHVKNVGFVLSEIKRVLKPKGKLVLITDNASYYLFHMWKPYSAHYYNYDAYGVEDKHFSLFTTKHIENFMKAFDFKIEKIDLITWYDPTRKNPIQKYPQNSKLSIPNRIVGNLPVISHMAFPRILVVAEK